MNTRRKHTTIFTNMHSLLREMACYDRWPVSLELPDPFNPNEPQPIYLSTHFYSNELAGNILKSKRNKITACPHTDQRHYAKNMCSNCYRKLGREKLAWDCEHLDQPLYAKGKCHICYIDDYNRRLIAKKRRRRYRR